MGDVVSGLLSFSACEVMAFPAYQEFALSFEVRVGKRYGAGDYSGLEFLPGYSLPCIGEWHSEKLPLSRRFLVVVEICFMGSVAWGNEVGLFGSLAGRGGYCLGVG
ncbi:MULTISPECIES: hypothetical protein [Klebsiella pneumoniae complex]|uniref:hypothetical protein n=1 Tax=Klebsiella pneumoniae complex TaxID=3390273 RepID=UPI000F7F3026|nr:MULTISPECIES: hypothetical protein [Klebsiella]RTD70891.1 hypothetical protein EJ896_18705 [Klebsiella quasipneumoniae subsp. similipneumoniae]